jgi:hypothetical protein
MDGRDVAAAATQLQWWVTSSWRRPVTQSLLPPTNHALTGGVARSNEVLVGQQEGCLGCSPAGPLKRWRGMCPAGQRRQGVTTSLRPGPALSARHALLELPRMSLLLQAREVSTPPNPPSQISAMQVANAGCSCPGWRAPAGSWKVAAGGSAVAGAPPLPSCFHPPLRMLGTNVGGAPATK